MNDTIKILIASRREEDQKILSNALFDQFDSFLIDITKDETGVIIKSEFFQPHILILDLQLSDISIYNLIRIIRRKSPATSIIVMYDGLFFEIPFDITSIISEISGLLLKETDINKLAYIVKIIFLGGCYINTSITMRIIKSISFYTQLTEKINQKEFTSTERNIISLYIRGLSDSQIADELNLSTGTVRNYFSDIKQRINTKSRIDVVIYSLVSGFIGMENLSM